MAGRKAKLGETTIQLSKVFFNAVTQRRKRILIQVFFNAEGNSLVLAAECNGFFVPEDLRGLGDLLFKANFF